MPMSNSQVYWVMFSFFVVIQASTVSRRWKLPFLRGPEWFFDVHVGPDFYSGAGRPILRRHRLRLLLPYAVELVALAAILLFGQPVHLLYLMFGVMVLIVGNHVLAMQAARRQARPFEIPGGRREVSSVALSLTTRRLGDYTNRRLEAALAVATLGALAWLAHLRAAAPGETGLDELFGVPILLLYLQAGLLLAKRGLVAWRTPIPLDQAETYMDGREHARRFFLDVCDSIRILLAGALVLWAIRQSAGHPWETNGARAIMLFAWLVSASLWAVWLTRRRNLFLAVAGRTPPVKMPDLAEGDAHSARWVCFLSSHPVLFVKGTRGYALNLASRRTQAGVLYLAGLAALCAWLFVG